MYKEICLYVAAAVIDTANEVSKISNVRGKIPLIRGAVCVVAAMGTDKGLIIATMATKNMDEDFM